MFPLTIFEVQVQNLERDDAPLLSLEDVQALEAAGILKGIVVGGHDLFLGRRNQLAAAILRLGLPRCPEREKKVRKVKIDPRFSTGRYNHELRSLS